MVVDKSTPVQVTEKGELSCIMVQYHTACPYVVITAHALDHRSRITCGSIMLIFRNVQNKPEHKIKMSKDTS